MVKLLLEIAELCWLEETLVLVTEDFQNLLAQ